MEQLSKKLKYWEYSNERYWRELKQNASEDVLWLVQRSLQSLRFLARFLVFLSLKLLKRVMLLFRYAFLLFFACVSTRALRLQRQPGEFVLSEDLYRQLNESTNYSPLLRK